MEAPTLDLVFDTAEGAVEEFIRKQDIPEVEAILLVVGSVVEDQILDTVEGATREALRALDRIPDRRGLQAVDPVDEEPDRAEEIILAILASLVLRLERPLTSETSRVVGEGALRLLRAGANARGFLFDLGDPETSRQLLVAAADLELIVAGHVTTVRERLQQHLLSFLQERALRVGGARSEWVTELRRLLGEDTSRWLLPALDVWAYRWFNIGGVLGSFRGATRVTSVSLVAFNNPPRGPDQRTTPFCNWVHGKIIAVSTVRQQLRDYADAVTAGDSERARQVWPLLSGRGDNAKFSREFKQVGLPPYHFRCRTVVVPE